MKTRPHGIVATFSSSDALIEALREIRGAGYEKIDVYTPWPVEEAYKLVPSKRSPIPLVMLVAGTFGMIGAFLLQVWAATDYPVQVAGRPLFSWPAFVPVTFELTVLTASVFGLLSLLFVARLPRLDHPIFSYSEFDRASQDAFVLCIRSEDAHFNPEQTARLLRDLGAQHIERVEA